MITTTRLDQFLADRFTDQDEMRDIVQYGMSQGIGGVIYSSELRDLWDEYETDWEEMLDDLDIHFADLVDDVNRWTLQEYLEKAIWSIVENYCWQKLNA